MESENSSGFLRRLRVGLSLLVGLRKHDLRAAVTFMSTFYTGRALPVRLLKMAGWAMGQMFGAIPRALETVTFERPVSRTPIWLAEGNRLANHPWENDPEARLPESVDAVIIGAGMTGASCAYHWSKGADEQTAVVLDMHDPAWGASGRNEGLVVMGRYFAMVRDTVRPHLDRVRSDLTLDERGRLAEQFAAAYTLSAYRNADLIEQTVLEEGFECDYAREGWIQARSEGAQASLRESVEAGHAHGFEDWTSLSPEDVLEKGGMIVQSSAGLSHRAASFHPAKWVWSLLENAMELPNVRLFTRTRVTAVERVGDDYVVQTDRGAIRARSVINAIESHTAALHKRYGEFIYPRQTQAAFGSGGPEGMKPHIGLSGLQGWFGRHFGGVMVGSDNTRISARHANCINPSRFITGFLFGELHRHFGQSRVHVTHEWSGTPGFTDDEFPVVGVLDGHRQWLIGGMCGSGTAVSFNGARHVVQKVLGVEGPDDYPEAYFSPRRLLDPENHRWPEVKQNY